MMPRPGPRLIDDFLIPALNTKKYGDKLVWVDEEKKIFSMKWSHKSCGSWTEEDTIVFQDWDKKKGNWDPGKKDYLMYSKQRFRSALNKLNVRKLKFVMTFPNKDVRIYQLRDNEGKKNLKTGVTPSQNLPENRRNYIEAIEAAEALLELQKSFKKCDSSPYTATRGTGKADSPISVVKSEGTTNWNEFNDVKIRLYTSQKCLNPLLSDEDLSNDNESIK